MRSSIVMVAAALAVASPAFAAPASELDASGPVLWQIRIALASERATLKVSTPKAVSLLDRMLIEQYGARGHLMHEPDATLKPGFYRAATLLMNGYPIAGGTLVNALRHRPAFAKSPSGPALAAFVDAMLQPTGEDDADLVAMQAQTRAALQHVRGLPANQRLAAQVMLLGIIYHDAIAVRAGRAVWKASQPDAAAQAAVTAARSAIETIPVPAPRDL